MILPKKKWTERLNFHKEDQSCGMNNIRRSEKTGTAEGLKASMNTLKTSKNIASSHLGRVFRTVFLAGIGLAAAAVLTAPASASFILSDLGYDDQGWVLFALEGKLKIDDSTVDGDIAAGEKADIDIKDESTVTGDVYVFSTKGKLSVKDDSQILGNVYTDSVDKVEVKDGSSIDGGVSSPTVKNGLDVKLDDDSTIGGSVTTDTSSTNALLNMMKQQAITASTNARNLAANRTLSGGGTKVDMSGGSGGFTASGAALNNTYVLKITDFKLDNGATYTLTGDSNSKLVINVSNNFEIKKGSTLTLAGGLLAENVLFNLTGGGEAKIEESTLAGLILATDRTVKVSKDSTLTAEIIAKSIEFTDSSITVVSNP